MDRLERQVQAAFHRQKLLATFMVSLKRQSFTVFLTNRYMEAIVITKLSLEILVIFLTIPVTTKEV
jgi:hypothetical protein